MRVKFITDATAVTEVGRETLFCEGDVQDLNDASAVRWIRRGVAVEDIATEKKTTKKSAKKRRRASKCSRY